MDFYEVIEKRRSVRAYKSEPIPEAALQNIAKAVQVAPSACNKQPWKIQIIRDKKLLAKICAHYPDSWLAEAPAIVVALGNSEECWKRPEGKAIVDIDIGIVMEHVVLAACAESLSTCWICYYNLAEMNAALGVSAPWSVLAISPLGYSNETKPKDIKRKNIKEIFEII